MKSLLTILLALTTIYCSATKKQKNIVKHSYEEYVDLYGKNDTSRAIIELFFDKREMNAGAKMSFLPVSLGVTVVVPPIGVALVAVSTPLFVSGLITKRRYNHKNLTAVLNAYNKDGVLPRRMKKIVKQILYAENEIEGEYQTAMRKQALRPIDRLNDKSNTILVVK